MTTWVTFSASDAVDFRRRAVRRESAQQPRLAGALAAITAAVVGVILNLSVWFALHVLFGTVQEMHVGPLRWYAFDSLASISRPRSLPLIAGVLAFRFHLGLVATVAIMAALGIAIRLIWLIICSCSALSCQRRSIRCESSDSAAKITTPATDSSSSAANMRGMLSR